MFKSRDRSVVLGQVMEMSEVLNKDFGGRAASVNTMLCYVNKKKHMDAITPSSCLPA